jgi:hypothetical protein
MSGSNPTAGTRRLIMYSELTIAFIDYRNDPLKPTEAPDFCFVARFKEAGITAYGTTIQIATDKAVEMLKYKNSLQANP